MEKILGEEQLRVFPMSHRGHKPETDTQIHNTQGRYTHSIQKTDEIKLLFTETTANVVDTYRHLKRVKRRADTCRLLQLLLH